MGRLRAWVNRLERESRGELVRIPQMDGSVATFPQSALGEAAAVTFAKMRGESVEQHPLNLAAQSSSDPQWSQSPLVGEPMMVDAAGNRMPITSVPVLSD